MIVNGRVYDVSSFIKRHPGGSVIKFQLGSDASDAYNNFHLRSKKADKMLASLPNRPVDSKEYSMTRCRATTSSFVRSLRTRATSSPTCGMRPTASSRWWPCTRRACT